LIFLKVFEFFQFFILFEVFTNKNSSAEEEGLRRHDGYFGLAEAVECDNMCREIQALPIGNHNDEVSWPLEASRVFSTRSVYLSLSYEAAITHFIEVWRTRVPPKIRVVV
jgi:hypothetical protein